MAKSNTKGMVKAEVSDEALDSYETVLKSIVKKMCPCGERA